MPGIIENELIINELIIQQLTINIQNTSEIFLRSITLEVSSNFAFYIQKLRKIFKC